MNMFDDMYEELNKTSTKRKKVYLSSVSINKAIGARDPNDFYATPAGSVIRLLEQEEFNGNILEPCCGDGAISKVLIEFGYTVKSQDLINRNYGEGGIDFLSTIDKYDNIITNPPFKDALYFVGHAKQITNNKICLLLSTSFLESKTRYEMFQDKLFPLKCIYQFVNRVTFFKSGENNNPTNGMIPFAWFVWDKQYIGEPLIRWIS